MEIPETKHFIPKGFELGTTLSLPNRLMGMSFQIKKLKLNNAPNDAIKKLQ